MPPTVVTRGRLSKRGNDPASKGASDENEQDPGQKQIAVRREIDERYGRSCQHEKEIDPQMTFCPRGPIKKVKITDKHAGKKERKIAQK
jgi:hypothetical protein